MAYDKMDYHYGGDFPKGLPHANGGTHIGMFLAWCFLNGLQGELHDEEFSDELHLLRERKITGRDYFQRCCDEKFWTEDLNEEGNAFTSLYYAKDGGGGYGPYLDDYSDVLAEGLKSVYEVADSWENYDKLAVIISQRYEEFKKTGRIHG